MFPRAGTVFGGTLEEASQCGEDHAVLLAVGRFLAPDDVLQGRDSYDDSADVDALGTLSEVGVSVGPARPTRGADS